MYVYIYIYIYICIHTYTWRERYRQTDARVREDLVGAGISEPKKEGTLTLRIS